MSENNGREHAERRAAQAAAARRHNNKDKARKYPGRHNRGAQNKAAIKEGH